MASIAALTSVSVSIRQFLSLLSQPFFMSSDSVTGYEEELWRLLSPVSAYYPSVSDLNSSSSKPSIVARKASLLLTRPFAVPIAASLFLLFLVGSWWTSHFSLVPPPPPSASKELGKGAERFPAAPTLLCAPLCVFYYYFPSWHATPENNRYHPFGTTDWDLIRQVLNDTPALGAIPQHDIHNLEWLQQPGELGYYNALNRDTRRRQGELAQRYGGGGFIYHIYWFERSPLFEDFFRLLLLDGQPAAPFFFDWATEDWRISGDFTWRMCNTSDDNRRAFFRWVAPFMRDSRYVRVHNKPVLSFYQWRPEICDELIASLRRFAYEEREANGFEDLYIVRVLAHFNLPDEHNMTAPDLPYDAVMEFLPNWSRNWHDRGPSLETVNWQKVFPVHWRGMPANWDSRPRSLWGNKRFGRYELHPYEFERHFRLVWNKSMEELHPPGVPNIITVNAWNEWSEGSVMEPSLQLQRRMLEKVQRTLLAHYRGVFSVVLPIYLVDANSGLLRDLVTAALTALDLALASTPSAGRAHPLFFDFELLVVLMDSTPVLLELNGLRATLLSFAHPRLRFIDTPTVSLDDWAATVQAREQLNKLLNESTGDLGPRQQPIPPSTLHYVLTQSRAVQTPDWFLVLHGVHNATSLQSLAQLSNNADGQLQAVLPLVTSFRLGFSPWVAYRLDYVELHWNEYLAEYPSPIAVTS